MLLRSSPKGILNLLILSWPCRKLSSTLVSETIDRLIFPLNCSTRKSHLFHRKCLFMCAIVRLSKACVRYFLSNFYFFIKWKLFKNYQKCFLFHLKSAFPSWDIQILVIFSLPFHAFQIQKDKGGIIYDVTNWPA